MIGQHDKMMTRHADRGSNDRPRNIGVAINDKGGDCWNVVIDVKVMAKQARSQDECIIKIVEMMSLTLNSRRSLIKDKKRKDITKHM